MQNRLTNFTDLTLDEKKMVLLWRNHESIRKWMFTQEEISLENHLSYIDSLSKQTDRIYFVVKRGDESIGVIDFTNIHDNQAYIGLYAQPNLRGVGKILMEAIVNYGFTTLKLNRLISEVFETNKAAIQLYTKFGFSMINKKETILTMELCNENG